MQKKTATPTPHDKHRAANEKSEAALDLFSSLRTDLDESSALHEEAEREAREQAEEAAALAERARIARERNARTRAAVDSILGA